MGEHAHSLNWLQELQTRRFRASHASGASGCIRPKHGVATYVIWCINTVLVAHKNMPSDERDDMKKVENGRGDVLRQGY